MLHSVEVCYVDEPHHNLCSGLTDGATPLSLGRPKKIWKTNYLKTSRKVCFTHPLDGQEDWGQKTI